MFILNTCHICLDDIEYRANELLKTCCEAFICNACWIDLRENETITICPICEVPFQREIIEENQTVFDTSEIKTTIRKLCIVFKWLTIGYLSSNILVFIFYLDVLEYLSFMEKLNKIIYFWPICIIYGYFHIVVWESTLNRSCHTWYD